MTAANNANNNLSPWQPGQSSNPPGRPKGTRDLAGYVLETTDGGKDLVNALVPIAKSGTKWRKSGLVFTGPTGGPLSDRVARDQFYRILEIAGLRRQRFHDLRHSYASLMISQGLPSREVMEALGMTPLAKHTRASINSLPPPSGLKHIGS